MLLLHHAGVRLSAQPAAPAGKAVFIRESEVYAVPLPWDPAPAGSAGRGPLKSPAQPRPRQLTRDGVFKQMPQWSPDGARIAYLVDGEPGKTLGVIVVIGEDGAALARLSIPAPRPSPGVMRAIERFEWIDDRRIGFQGSIGRGAVEYSVIDAKTGERLIDRLGSDFSWSPDRSRLAQSGFVPFSSTPDLRTAYIQIDGEKVYPLPSDRREYELRSNIAWSPQSDRLAFIVEDLAKMELLLVVLAPWSGSSSIDEQLPLPASQGVIQSLAWDAGGLLAIGHGRIWSYEEPGRRLRPWTAAEIRSREHLLAAGQQQTGKLRELVERFDGADSDYWPQADRPPGSHAGPSKGHER